MISEKVCLEVMEAMKTAGARMLDAHPGRNEVHKKEGRANFVTDYDVANQRFLETAFREILPDATFLGEENTGRERVRSLPDGLLWIVDPIDGTTNFMYGYDFSTISVGLALDGRMEAGFVFNPYRQDMYHAVRGQGAFRNGECLPPLTGGVEDGIVAFGCAGYNEEHTEVLFQALQMLYHRAPAIRSGGSAAWDLARIAGGCNGVYLEMLLQPWDYAAASLIIEETGGVITQMDGTPVSLIRPSSVVAGTPQAQAETLRIVQACRNADGTRKGEKEC